MHSLGAPLLPAVVRVLLPPLVGKVAVEVFRVDGLGSALVTLGILQRAFRVRNDDE